jgi:ABC-type transport system substrate-binding protein
MNHALKIGFAVGAFVTLLVGGLLLLQKREHKNTITIGFPAAWGALKPALQHSLFGDVILGNVYEPLVRLTSRGTLRPCGAKAWTVSDDRRVFTFHIDTTRRFSDGTSLTAQHFKTAWEHGLGLSPQSANSSLADVLYKVVGAENFDSTQTLSGVRALDAQTLQIEFKTPFRMALEYLAGIRYSAILKSGEHELGTGPYRFVSHTDTEVKFERNPHAPVQPSFATATILKIPLESAKKELEAGTLDAYHDFGRAPEPLCQQGTTLECFVGVESAHEAFEVNALPNRLFANPQMRLALQALLYAENGKALNLIRKASGSFRVDAQSFLPLQAGRIPTEEFEALVAKGKEYIPSLIAATEKQPLVVYTSQAAALVDVLKSLGLHLAPESGYRDFKDLQEIYYKTHDVDLLYGGFSVASGDPDGIYHVLGKEGAIASPMTQREGVMALLEEGRKILNISELPVHYQKVTRAIFTEVPYIHVGYRIAQISYRSDRVRLNEVVKGRDDDDIVLYEPL